MKGFVALYRKEVFALFLSPLAYVIVSIFLLLMSYTFCAYLFHSESASIARLSMQSASLLIILVPLLTMRQFAEEKRIRTLELLLTCPVSDAAVVLAKFSATYTLVIVLLCAQLILPATISLYADLDWGVLASSYVGLCLFSAVLVMLGLAVSSCTSSQLIAALITMGLFLFLWMSETLGIFLPPPLDQILISTSFDTRLTPFVTGTVYLSDIGFFYSAFVIGTVFCVVVLQRR